MDTSSTTLSKTLEDTQASLATALARIEAYRIREKFLLQENFKLREELKKNEGKTLDAALKATLSRRFDRIGSSEGFPEEPITRDSQSREHINYRLHEEYPITLYTSKGKVPASLSANPDNLEVFESVARINSNQFVGMTNLSADKARPESRSPKFMSKNWTSYLFGKMKTTDTSGSPRKSSTRRENKLDGPPKLQRKSWCGPTEVSKSAEDTRDDSGTMTSIWQILWKDGGGNSKLKQVVFEASVAAQAFINRQIESWSDAASRAAATVEEYSKKLDEASEAEVSDVHSRSSLADEGVVVPPKHLMPNGPLPGMMTDSELLNEELLRCLTSAMPPRFRHSTWNLLYATTKHGFSLQTLYRKAAGSVPSIMVIRDGSDFVFGAYCSEAWKMGPRFFGTGETFVFQLEPHRVSYPWKQESTVRNNFFMFGSPESLAVGGTGHFAIWLDSDLLYGHSGICDTFGSPCIAAKEEFKIMKLELWGLT